MKKENEKLVILETPKKLEILKVSASALRTRFCGFEFPIDKKGIKEFTNERNVYPYISYAGMTEMFISDLILNNDIIEKAYEAGWNVEIENGTDYDDDGDYVDVYQYYIIDWQSAERLKDWTNELIYYISDIDMYVLGVTHCGTSWDCVSSDVLTYGLDELEYADDVRALARKYQNYISEHDIYMSEQVEWQEIFEELGKKFEMLDELKENGII